MRTILMDGDPGHDDVIAFLLALGNPSQLNIAGFTTVAGNSSAENCTKNILKIMDYLGVSIPVARGYESPLVKPLNTAARFHGETGLDGALNYPAAVSAADPRHAVAFQRDILLSSREKVTLVTMGPLTNIAILLKTYPEVIDHIEEIVMMGGTRSVYPDTQAAEFNVWCDPEALEIVLQSGIDLTMVSLDATSHACLNARQAQQIR